MVEAFDQHGEVGVIMRASLVMMIEEARSPEVVESPQALLESSVFSKQVPMAIEYASPIAASLKSPTQSLLLARQPRNVV